MSDKKAEAPKPIVQTNPSPKTRFRQSADFINKHRSMMELPAFERACDYSMLEYQRQVASTQMATLNDAIGNYYRLLGAQEFLGILKNLSESPLPPTPAQQKNLNYLA